MPEKVSSGCLRHHPVTGQWVGRCLLPTKGQVGALHNGETPAGINGGLRASRPTGRCVEPPVGDGVLPWSAAEQMPLGYDIPSARQRRAARPPLGGACRRGRLGRAISLPPSALRAATSLAEGGKGKRIPTPVRALARNDRETGRTGSPASTERNKSRTETGRRGRRPLRSDRETGRTESSAPTMCNRAPQWTKVSAAQLRTLLYKCGWVKAYL